MLCFLFYVLPYLYCAFCFLLFVLSAFWVTDDVLYRVSQYHRYHTLPGHTTVVLLRYSSATVFLYTVPYGYDTSYIVPGYDCIINIYL